MKIPSVQKTITVRVSARVSSKSVKKKPLDEKLQIIDDEPLIVDDAVFEDIKPLVILKSEQKSPGEKKLQVNIETLTLKPAQRGHAQTARRGIGWKRGQHKKEWMGRTDNKEVKNVSYNELDTARS